MKAQKDRHLESPGEANRDKHINFLAEENSDADPATETFDDNANDNENDTSEVDNGFFMDDNNELQTKEESEDDKSAHPSTQKQKVSPSEPDKKITLGDRITVANKNEDILTQIKDDNNTAYTNNTNQAG